MKVLSLLLLFLQLRLNESIYLPGLKPKSFCAEGSSGHGTLCMILVGKNEGKCLTMCKKTYSTTTDSYSFLRKAVIDQFAHRWVVDNLPVLTCFEKPSAKKASCFTYIPLGCSKYSNNLFDPFCQTLFQSSETPVLFNHVDFRIIYHKSTASAWGDESPKDSIRIISVAVEPKSIDHVNPDKPDCEFNTPLLLPKTIGDHPLTIAYTYSYTFQETTEIKWSSRWDYLLELIPTNQIHWLSIINAVVLVLFLSGVVAFILLRTLRRDIARYSQLDNNSLDVQEESGWKLVHGDVFRPPRWGMLLSVIVGSGFQLLVMLLVTMFFACLGFLSPAHRGALLTCALALFVCLGMCAGYVSARIYKLFGGLRWRSNVLLTAILCPGIAFADVFLLNVALWSLHSASAIPFGTLVGLLAMWLLVSVPLCFVGAFFGFRRAAIEVPVRINQIPRQIPLSASYSQPWIAFFIAGLLPFGCLFIQLFFIFNSVWGSQFYFMFGLLFLVMILLLITCAETAILLCYFQLCSEDYRWWWKPFYAPAGTAFYLGVYSLYYFAMRLDFRDAISGFLYFGYMAVIIWIAFLFMGTVSFLASLWFVRKIYSTVKVD